MAQKWYVVHTYSNFENKAKLSLEERVKQYKCEEYFSGVFVPTEQVATTGKSGGKKTVNRKFFPGYILVRMELNDTTWHVVMDTPKVTGFVGGRNTPSTIPDDEVDKLKTQLEEGLEGKTLRCEFAVGDEVTVTEGPFQSFSGSVDEIKLDKGTVKVLVQVFGRSTPVELSFNQVSKK